MAMGDNEGLRGGGYGLDNQCESVGGGPPESPWKISATACPVTEPDSESWPALWEAHQRSKNGENVDSSSSKSLSLPPPSQIDRFGVPMTDTPPAPVEQPKFPGRGKFRSPRRPNIVYQNSAGPNHAQNGPPFSLPLPYYLPPYSPYFHHMAPVLPIANPPPYAYRQPFGPFPRVDAQVVDSGSDPGQASIPLMDGGFQPLLHTASSIHDSNAIGRKPVLKKQGGHINPAWHNQRPVYSNSVHLWQSTGPRPFMKSPVYGPIGYVDRSGFQGPPGGIYYYPAHPPPGSIRVPYSPVYVPYPGCPMPHSPIMLLRASVVKQIEYYFSDENLRTDRYLIDRMDDQGWVPISVIAGFKRIVSMKVDISFILDALQTSESVEVQDEKVRRRNEWSKWIPSPSLDAIPSKNIDNENQRNDLERKAELPPANVSSAGSLTLESGIAKSNDDMENGKDEALSNVETQSVSCEDSSSIADLSFQLNTDLNSLSFTHVVDTIESVVSGNGDNRKSQEPRCLDEEPSDDFYSAFILDEELEKLQRMSSNGHSLTVGSVDGEDEEMAVNDQVVDRLVIVTQNSRMHEGLTEESKTIAHELAPNINDGVYFCEQELNSKWANRRHYRIITEGGVESISCTGGSPKAFSGVPNDSTERNSCGSPGYSDYRKKSDKGSPKCQSIHKQFLFYGDYKAHGSGKSAGEDMLGSPTDAVGLFFGSTTPDNYGTRPSSLSASPQSNRSENSSLVGSVPKSFPPFQHPSHQLLQENGFKQQLYNKYKYRCLADRENLGIGCSEEMNTLYRFWCYFLRNMFVTSMYNEFKELALEDAGAGYNYGIECLFRFYSYGLEKEFRDDLYKDFEQLTLSFYKKRNLYGLEKYWAFHHYRAAQGLAEPLEKHPELDRLLQEDYSSLDDFQRAKAQGAGLHTNAQ